MKAEDILKLAYQSCRQTDRCTHTHSVTHKDIQKLLQGHAYTGATGGNQVLALNFQKVSYIYITTKI